MNKKKLKKDLSGNFLSLLASADATWGNVKKKTKTVFLAIVAWTAPISAQTLPYQNPTLSAAERAEDLLSRLTIEEKVGLMMNGSPAIKRLGVPEFDWWNEALHGIGRNGFATVFPITMHMAASWNDELLHRVFTAVSDEARAKNQQAKRTGHVKRYQNLSYWTPNINIFRDPRWGRGQETYGEDPYLTSRMGLAVVRGLQGMTFDGRWLSAPGTVVTDGQPHYKKLLACAKHFAVHSGPEWNRHTFNIENLPERDLWETYLPAFKALVQEGEVAEVMCAYQRIDGQACCAQNRYEQQILRQEWGFKGLVCSDCGAVRDFLPKWHDVAKDEREAASMAVLSGTDVECGSIYKSLPEAIRHGDVKESDLDRSLRRLLIARIELGDLDSDELVTWTKVPESCIASKEHKRLALDMAREGIVLLTNNGVLPLTEDDGDIVIMGPNADNAVMQWGNYAGSPTNTITALDGIRAVLPDTKYIQGCSYTRNEAYESRYSQITDPLGNKGMQAMFWNNTSMQGSPVATVTLAQPINLNNGGNTVFAPGIRLEGFSARLDGTFRPVKDETLVFSLRGDDMVRLIVNGDTLIDVWKVRHRIQGGQKEIKVKVGQDYRIHIDYAQETGYASLAFDIQKVISPTREELLSQVGKAKTIVFVGGIGPTLEGEEMSVKEPGFKGGDRTDIELPEAQRRVIGWLKEAGKRVIFVNCSGGAMGLQAEKETCDAIVQWWYSGEQGGQALADVLFGRYNPTGKLPITFYRSTDDLPDFLDYTMKGRTYRYFKGQPLWAFGHGLSYTTFDIARPKYKNSRLTVTVRNTGSREGTEVVQVYFRRPDDTDGPAKTLCAYRRVSLKPGEQQTVNIDITPRQLQAWDAQTNTMRVIPGRYLLMVGNASDDPQMKTVSINY